MKYGPDEHQGLGFTEQGNRTTWKMRGDLFGAGSRLLLRDGAIVFDPALAGSGTMVEPSIETLWEFVALARQGTRDENILRFAQTWGQLGLCPHGLPRSHSPNLLPSSLAFGFRLQGEFQCHSGEGAPEQLEWWRYWAAQAAAIVGVVARLRADQRGTAEDWDTLAAPGPWVHGDDWTRVRRVIEDTMVSLREDKSASLRAQRTVMATTLSEWLMLANLRPDVTWRSSDVPRQRLGFSSLFGALGLLLILVSANAGGLALCRGCGALVVPGRRLGLRERGFWCTTCRTLGRPRREAAREYQRRKAAEPEYRAQEAERQRARRSARRDQDMES